MKQHNQCRCEDDYTCESCSDEIAKSFKQHITKEQWNELIEEHKNDLMDFFDYKSDFQLTIGQMIEYLTKKGWDLAITWYEDEDEWRISRRIYEKQLATDVILCDALWEAVKHKLNQ